MKKLILLVVLTTTCTLSFAQNATSWGIKGGLNYNANGNYFESVEANAQHPDRNIGYHIGFFGRLGGDLYFRPELVYTKTKSDYASSAFDMRKIDAPLLVGVNIIGPISLFGGPSFQYILDSEFEGTSIDDVDKDLTVGLNFGAALNFNKFSIDLRYERGFSNNEANFLANNNIGTSRLDTRPDQLIVSLSIVL